MPVSNTKSSLLFTVDGGNFGTIEDQAVTVATPGATGTATGSPTALGGGNANSGPFVLAIADDAADGFYFVSTQSSSGNNLNYSEIYKERFGQTPTFTTANQVLSTPIPPVNTAGQSAFINSIALDVPDHILYYESNTNFYEVKYGSSFNATPSTPTLLATLPNSIRSFALDLADHTAYFTAQNITESLGFSGSSTETINGNYIYRLSGVTPTATQASIGAPTTYNVPFTGTSNPGPVGGIAVDSANDTVYFTTAPADVPSADPGAKAGIYSLPANFTTSTAIHTVALTGQSPPATDNGSIVVDPVTGDYYYVALNASSVPAIYTGNVNSPTTTSLLVTSGSHPVELAIDDSPAVTNITVSSIDGNTSRTTGEVQPGDTVAITAAFNEPETVTGTPKLTLNDGGTASYSSGSGTAFLVFTYAPAAGQNATTLAVTGLTTDASDTVGNLAGTPANTANVTATLTGLQVDSTAPTLSLTGTSGEAVQGGSSLLLLAAVPTIVDNTGDATLTGAKVQITSGFQTGDAFGANGSQATQLAFGDSSSIITLTYGAGSVALTGDASVTDYRLALDEITLTDGGTHTAANSHPTQSVSWTVTEGSLTSSPATTTVTIDRAPAVASGGVTTKLVEGATSTGAAGAALTGDTDGDGDMLAIATVAHGATSVAAGSAVAGTYGSLTLDANGSYTYAATNTTAIDNAAAGAPLVDTFSFQVSDGVTTTAESFTATVLRPAVLTTDAGATGYPARQPAVVVDPGVTLTDADTTTIASATVTITTGLATGDALALGSNIGGLTGSYANGTLSITGSATVSQYQTALQSVTYGSTSADPGNGGQDATRVASFTVMDSLGVASDTATKTIDENPACYCTGTLIESEHGEVAVEDLRIGDTLVTYSGALRAISWIGHRTYGGRFVAGKRHLLPIRFRSGSLGNGLPRRDLLVSPEHAMFLDGMLIPARALTNGTTIVQEPAMARIDYIHIELASHDVILAEGAPSESFIDDDSRMVFHNAGEYFALYPDQAFRRAEYCAPRVEQGAQLEAVRQLLATQAELKRIA